MRIRIAAAAGVGLLAATLTMPALAATQEVLVGSYYFEDASPDDAQIVVDGGDRINFTFQGSQQHTATVDGLFDSGPHGEPQTYRTPPLTRAGTYTLYCQVHGPPTHSTALVVRARAAASPSAAPTPRPPPSPTPSATRSPSRAASPAATAARLAPIPARTSAAPSPAVSASASAPLRPSAVPAPAPAPPTSALPGPSESPEFAAPFTTDLPAADGDDNLLLSAVLLLGLLAGLTATGLALGRRRP